MSRGLRAAWPVLVWMGIILAATSLPAPRSVALGGEGLDKAVHFGLYFGLGWTAARALRVAGRLSAATVVATVIAGCAFGALDEWHQSLLFARHPSLADWLADAGGVLLGVPANLWRGIASKDRDEERQRRR